MMGARPCSAAAQAKAAALSRFPGCGGSSCGDFQAVGLLTKIWMVSQPSFWAMSSAWSGFALIGMCRPSFTAAPLHPLALKEGIAAGYRPGKLQKRLEMVQRAHWVRYGPHHWRIPLLPGGSLP